MKRAANVWLTLLFVLVYLLLGAFLIINPQPSTDIISGVIAGILAFMGIVRIIGYFKMDSYEAMIKKELCNGLFLVLAAFVVIMKRETISAFIPIALSIVLLYEAMTNLQQAVDLLRVKNTTWIVEIISFVVVLAMSLICLFGWFGFTGSSLMCFIGISYVVAALASLVSMFLMMNYKKKHDANKAEIAEAKAE